MTDSLGIDLYRSDDYVKVGRVDLLTLLREVFRTELGESLDDVQFALLFHPITDQQELLGSPAMVNLRSSHGYLTVQIVRNGHLIYRHPHSVRELIARPLQQALAKRLPDEVHWGFGIAGPGMERVRLERPAPRLAGSVDLPIRPAGPRLLHVEELPDPEPPAVELVDLGAARPADDAGDVTVVPTPEVYRALLGGLPLSDEVEEGGFLVGRLFRDDTGRLVVRVTDVVPAERTGASLLHFTFTGESFLRVNQTVAERGGDARLVGWYHTHLFPATGEFGLSTTDVELHARTFRRRWHLAALLNLDEGARALRCYSWDGTSMHAVPVWTGERWTP